MAGWSEKVLDIDLSTHTHRTYPEESCQIELAVKTINEPFIEYRGMNGSYSKF